MRTFFKVFFSVSIALAVVSCSSGESEKSEEKANDKLGKIEVEIPESLKDNEEVVEYIENMSAVVDEYALLIDNIYEEAGEYIGKSEEDLSMMDKMKLVKIMGETGMKSGELMAKWGECLAVREDFGTSLNEDELLALETIGKRFEERMIQIQEKYEGVMDNGSEEEVAEEVAEEVTE